jgi:HK97 gp10 family phage protein
MMQFEMSGFDDALKNLRKVGDSVKGPAMTAGALKALEPVAEDARALAPVRRGTLRDNITISASLPDGTTDRYNGRAVHVGILTGKPFYAGFVELGTVNARAQPFLAPAVDANEALIFDILGAQTGALIEGAL